MTILGHEVRKNGIDPDCSKVESLLLMESPKTTKDFMSFVHKVKNLSRSFCMLAEVIHPLQAAMQQDPLQWGDKKQEAFEVIKEKISTLPIIMPPCNCGSQAVGEVLMQKGSKQSYMRLIYYISRTMGEVEKSWHLLEKLVWTLVFATKRLKSYLLHKPFVVLTSCQMLPHVLRYPGDNAKVQRWLLQLQQFEMTFITEESVRENMADMLT